MQILLVFLFYKIKRFSHGFAFISEQSYADNSVLVSVTVLFLLLINKQPNTPTIIYFYTWLLFIIITLLAFFWIRKSFKRKYADILKKNEISRLDQAQKKTDEELQKLKKENERLSTIIHKDNKLMASMLLAVKELTYKVAEENDSEKRKQECDRIASQLEEASGTRAELIRSYEHSGHRLPETGNSRIDSLLAYMDQRAFTEKISFEAVVDHGFMEAVRYRISTEDLATLLADLTENAIIATREQEQRNILVSLHQISGRPALAVYDSGVPFPEEVRQAWGKQRITTHAEEGGSGIGMETAFEICKKTQADFLIEEHPPVDLYTKCISVTF